MRRLGIQPYIMIALAASVAGAQELTQVDLLHRMIDLERLLSPPPAGERTASFSSFDRRQLEVNEGQYVNWDADEDRGHFLRAAADGWNVMADIKSPGVLTRIWCDQPTGDLRIVLDGQTVAEAPLADVFNGALSPFGEPLSYELGSGAGGVSYFPIGFSKDCQVLSRNFGGEYQIDYTAFASGTTVERFTTDLNETAAVELSRVAKVLKRGLTDKDLFGTRRTAPQAVQEDVKPGEKLTWELKNAGVVRALYVALTDRTEPNAIYALHNCLLRVYWDGRDTPDIECPLPAFFGTGFDRNLYNSLPMGTNLGSSMPGRFPSESWFMYCYFPMPFSNGARIEIENLNRKGVKIGLMLYMRVDTSAPPADALRFKARTRTEDPCKTFDFPVLKTSGVGRLVGCTLNIDCPREQWWGAGDHKMRIDGEPVPSILGTSTQGYFGDVQGLVARSRSLHGATRVSPVGKNSVYRWHIADCVDFQRSLDFTIENWQVGQADDVYYNSVAYWYGEPGADAEFNSLSEEALELPPLRIPGSVEIEDNIISKNWGNVYKQKYARGVELSGTAAATISTTDPVELDIPWKTPGRYRLSVRTLPGRSFGTVRVSDADGKEIGTATYNRNPEGMYTVGEITLKAGKNRVTIVCDKTAILDCWVLEPIEDASD